MAWDTLKGLVPTSRPLCSTLSLIFPLNIQLSCMSGRTLERLDKCKLSPRAGGPTRPPLLRPRAVCPPPCKTSPVLTEPFEVGPTVIPSKGEETEAQRRQVEIIHWQGSPPGPDCEGVPHHWEMEGDRG